MHPSTRAKHHLAPRRRVPPKREAPLRLRPPYPNPGAERVIARLLDLDHFSLPHTGRRHHCPRLSPTCFCRSFIRFAVTLVQQDGSHYNNVSLEPPSSVGRLATPLRISLPHSHVLNFAYACLADLRSPSPIPRMMIPCTFIPVLWTIFALAFG